MTTPDAITARLAAAQNPDGGFGARPGLPSAVEPTAWALLAQSFDARQTGPATRARHWLAAAQTPEGGWPAAAGLDTPSWTTSLAALALARYPDEAPRTTRAVQWLVTIEGRQLPDGRRWLARLLGRERAVVVDQSLIGWPWVPDTFSWVEPTAYALLALRAAGAGVPGRDARMTAATRMLLDRVCSDGGWNYGNSRVLGEELWGYPDTTALALLALGEAAPAAVATRGLDALDRMLAENPSGLATALGILAGRQRGRDVTALAARVRTRFDEKSVLWDTRTLALAALALDETARPFGEVGHA